jgi:FkbM family methyltransferase
MMVNLEDVHHGMRRDIGAARVLVESTRDELHEIGLLRDVMQYLPHGPVVLDIGASCGVHTLAFARGAEKLGGHVHAFEADRAVFHMLAGNVALNGHLNVRCHHVALGAPASEHAMPEVDSGEHGDLVRQIALDSLALPRVDLLRLDVDREALAALKGGRQTIARCKPVMCIGFSRSGNALRDFLFELGYQVFLMNHMNYACVHPERAVVGFRGLKAVLD